MGGVLTTLMTSLGPTQFKRLRIFNGVMAVFHFVQGLIMVFATNDFTLTITTQFQQFDRATQKLAPFTENLWDVRIGYLVATFLFLSALAHLLLVLPGINGWYTRNIKRGYNPMRWIEYAFSASVMIVAIGMLVGILDAFALLLMFGVNAAMILFGWAMELVNQNREKVEWSTYIFGVIMGILPWVAIAFHLFGAGEGDLRPPDFVYWIFFTIFVMFNTFAITMVLYFKKVGKFKNYLYAEFTYIVLSLVAKSLLAWLVFGGTLRPV